ncbi:MAG: hypothetical protein HY080_08115 [Gammaproteobacteria bacterium]|nr:hypothetical protein [Gammaproteobacteria bacterium]
MSTTIYNLNTQSESTRSRALLFVSPLAAMIYPLPLIGFHACVTVAANAVGSPTWLAWFAASILLLLAFMLPLASILSAMRLSAIQTPTKAELLARRIAFLSVASPPLFTLVGVIFYMLGMSDLDKWVLAVFWGALAIVIAYCDDHTQLTPPPKLAEANLRISHGIVATGILLIFLGFHLANHFFGLIGPEAHTSVMKALRHIYRAPFIEPVLLAGFLFLIISGFYLAWQLTNKATDRFRTFQVAAGVFLLFFIISHINASLVFARVYLGIDPGWGFATGAPTGLIHDAWNIRLLPYYWLGVFLVLSHLASGARAVMLAHGKQKKLADGVMIGGAAVSALASTLILLGMCGLRLHFV